MTPQELNYAPGVETAGLNSPRNALTFALQALLPARVTPRMLEGLREPEPHPDLNRRPARTPSGLQNLTNEQLTALALQPLLPQ